MQRTVAVVGGGISGLTACYQLARSPNAPKIILLEGSGRLGGWLHSTRTEDGAVFEHGPRGIRPAGSVGKNTLLMVSELGLDADVLPVPGDHPASKNRYLYVSGALHRLPSSIGGVLRTVPPFTRPLLWSGLHELAAPRGTQLDETIHSFVSRRFGKELADIAIDSLCRGVFAGDCRALSVRSCFPALFEAERRRRSVILGMALGGGKGPALDSALSRRARDERWSQWSLRGGMETLPEALQDFLRRHGVEMHCHARLQRLERTAAECWQITLEDGSVRADHVISAIPARGVRAPGPLIRRSLPAGHRLRLGRLPGAEWHRWSFCPAHGDAGRCVVRRGLWGPRDGARGKAAELCQGGSEGTPGPGSRALLHNCQGLHPPVHARPLAEDRDHQPLPGAGRTATEPDRGLLPGCLCERLYLQCQDGGHPAPGPGPVICHQAPTTYTNSASSGAPGQTTSSQYEERLPPEGWIPA
ncbi:protoporphyrinogen oxidase isoform X5 [Chelonia mydas]|uniref:protoporphyrinogen oxidase isoform X5 n=1 Tax=Chelonia mydas TaxID=8469 RepID=UPI0018A1DA98|nr:protoporphyrinogen oxidase isoform X5 [Chelonia mydas]